MRSFYGLVFAIVVMASMGAGCSWFSKTSVTSTPSVPGNTDSGAGGVATTTPDGKGKLPEGSATSGAMATSTPVAVASSTPVVKPVPTPAPRSSDERGSPSAATPALPSQVEVQMSENGFVPAEVKIVKGGKVVFKNVGKAPVWPASSKHPTHLDYAKFDPKKGIEPGGTYEIDFPEVKTYFYHDHIIASHFGKVVVE